MLILGKERIPRGRFKSVIVLIYKGRDSPVKNLSNRFNKYLTQTAGIMSIIQCSREMCSCQSKWSCTRPGYIDYALSVLRITDPEHPS